MQTIKDFLIVIKMYLDRPIYNLMYRHTILCPNCHKVWHKITPYRSGQITLCKKCRGNLDNNTNCNNVKINNWKPGRR